MIQYCWSPADMNTYISVLDPFHSREAMMSPDIGQCHEDYDRDSLYNWSGELYYESLDGEAVCFAD